MEFLSSSPNRNIVLPQHMLLQFSNISFERSRKRIIFSNFEKPAVSPLQILLKKIQNATSKEG
jgi:hypothetical protein